MASKLDPELGDSWEWMEKDVYKSLLAEYPASWIDFPTPETYLFPLEF